MSNPSIPAVGRLCGLGLLDCNSNFYGAYTGTGPQAEGEMVPPAIE
ncbi:MAG: hypothetical protein K9M97_06265 [Akkermansiaceae bacterium]|nr:hypothetical protein [Akkermansiaceae bacterium]